MNKKKSRNNIIVLIISLIIALFSAELILRFYYSSTGEIIGRNEEQLCHKFLFREMSDTNNPGRFDPYAAYYEYWNYSGVRIKANWNQNPVFDVVVGNGTPANMILHTINTNSQHIKAFSDFGIDTDKLRIVAVGDSFTWGGDVPQRFSYVSILQDLIPGSETLNFGIVGTGFDTAYLQWKYDAVNYKPDVTIFGIYIDDIRRTRPCIVKPKFEIVGGKLEISNFPPPMKEEIFVAHKPEKTISYLYDKLRYELHYFGGVKRSQYENGLEIAELMLEEVKQRSEEDGTYFMTLIIEGGNDHKIDQVEIEMIDKLKRILFKKGIPYVTSNQIFNREGYLAVDTSSTNKTRHFLPKGYAYIAQGIKNKLEDDGIIAKQKDFYIGFDKKKNILILQNKQNESDRQLIVPYTIIPKTI